MYWDVHVEEEGSVTSSNMQSQKSSKYPEGLKEVLKNLSEMIYSQCPMSFVNVFLHFQISHSKSAYLTATYSCIARPLYLG